jgi:hypothetical protein
MCNIQVKFFWVVILCSVMVRYHCFRGPCCLHLQDEVEGLNSPEDLDLNLHHNCSVIELYVKELNVTIPTANKKSLHKIHVRRLF